MGRNDISWSHLNVIMSRIIYDEAQTWTKKYYARYDALLQLDQL